jgi:hypothetical protein
MRKFLSTQVPCPEAGSNSAAASIRPPPSHFPQVMQYGRSGTSTAGKPLSGLGTLVVCGLSHWRYWPWCPRAGTCRGAIATFVITNVGTFRAEDAS